jgi:two-component system sensor histidine kinase PilS (NtrC family)
VDNNSRISYINQAGNAILEAEAGTLIGKDIFDLFPALGNYMKSQNHLPGVVSHSRIILNNFTKKNKIIGFSSSPLMDSENITIGKILIFQDLTRYKTMEKKVRESEKLATIGRFAAGLAHEIRNPLASLSGSIQILKDSLELSGTNRELMDIVLRETDRLNRLVADFLQFSHTKKEKLSQFNLRNLISEILSVLSKEVREDDATHFQNLLPNDFMIFSDRDRLKQVFWNLILNAIQAKDKKPLSIVISGEKFSRVQPEDPVENNCKISIQDTGKGFSKDTEKVIFDPFFTTRPNGTGLGLSITQQIVSSLGGTIHFNSKEGIGTTVHVTLPC